MGSKGINFSRASSSSWDVPISIVETKNDTPSELRIAFRKGSGRIDSLQEQYSDYVHLLSHAESPSTSTSSLREEIQHGVNNLTSIIQRMENTSMVPSLVNSHRSKLIDYKKQFDKTKRREEQLLQRIELLDDNNEGNTKKDSSRLDMLIDEKISMSQSHSQADTFLSHGNRLKEILSTQTMNLAKSASSVRDIGKGAIPELNSTMRAIKQKKTRNMIILASFISCLIIFLIVYSTYSRTSAGV